MKHISRRLLALLALCLALTSCARLEPSAVLDETTVSDGEHAWPYTPSDDAPVLGRILNATQTAYYDGGIYFSGIMMGVVTLREEETPGGDPMMSLRRLDVETGEITNVCPDPLCQHKTPACPFAGMNNRFSIDAEGNLIYTRLFGMRGETSRYAQLCSYNLNTKTWKIHYNELIENHMYASFFTRVLSHEGNLIYYQSSWEKQEDGEMKYRSYLVRENIRTGTREVLSSDKHGIPSSDHFLFVADNRIYFESPIEIYSTNFALEDKQTLYAANNMIVVVETDGRYVFFAQKETEETCLLYRMDMDGGNLTNLDIPIRSSQWTITQNYIYYQRVIPAVLIPDAEVDGGVIVSTDAIMRCDLNGENHEEIFVYNQPTEDAPPHYRTFIYMQPIGNYIYATEYGMIDENRNGKSERSERYSYRTNTTMRINRIDITTGEVTYIEPYKDFQ